MLVHLVEKYLGLCAKSDKSILKQWYDIEVVDKINDVVKHLLMFTSG